MRKANPLPTQKVGVLKQQPATSRHRHRGVNEPQPGEVASRDFIAVAADVIVENHALIWGDIAAKGDEKTVEANAHEWATILHRAMRWGTPTDDYQHEGWKVTDHDFGDPPLCANCRG